MMKPVLEMKPWDTVKVALDFDETVTTNPQIWGFVVEVLKQNGFDVRIVTARPDFGDNSDIEDFACKHDIKVVYCEGSPKSEVCNNLNWIPNIWIDDCPVNIPSKNEFLEYYGMK